MVLVGINRIAWVPNCSSQQSGPPLACGLYQFMSHTEGTALALFFESVYMEALTHLRFPTPYSWTQSDITGTEKNCFKNQ